MLALVWALAGCGQEAGVHYRHGGERYALEAAPYWFAMPPLEQVRDDFLTLLVNMDGMEGVLGLVEGAVGIDLAAPDLLAGAGLDGTMPPLLFGWRDATVAVLGVADARAFDRFLEGLAKGEGWELVRTRTDGPELLAAGNVALAVEGNLLTVLVAGDGEAVPRLAALLLEPAPETPLAPPEAGYAFSVRAGGMPLEQLLEGPLAAAGPAAGIVRSFLRYLDRCTRAAGSFTLSDRILLKLTAPGCTLGLVRELAMTPEAWAADDTILLLHTRAEGESLWTLFPAVLRYLGEEGWKELPGKRPDSLAKLGDLLGRFEPEVAAAFLGLSSEANFSTFTNTQEGPGPLFGAHFQVMLRLREGLALEEWRDEAVMKGLVPGFEPRGIGAGEVLGTEFCHESEKQGKRCFSVVQQGRMVHVVTGNGEGDRLVRTLRGQRKPLAEALFAHQVRGSVTATLKTRRLVKDLVSKGFPPYFLQVLSSILEVRLTASDGEAGTEVHVEVVLR